MPTADLVRIDLSVESAVARTARVRQLEAMFDVPATDKASRSWSGELPIGARPWRVGLIVGPSGCGKSSVARAAFGEVAPLEWKGGAVVDDFAPACSMEEIAAVCGAVGFNTIPAWVRPYSVLSNGERFRVEVARRLLETSGIVLLDEFTSVVDRQVAKIGAHAVQKYARKNGRQVVAATCHYDVTDWLQPDWILEPATMEFQWRELQRRPKIAVEIGRLPYEAWRLFAPYHYMSADLHRSARCYGLWADGTLASFAAYMYRPHPKARDIWGCSRAVTLPDWQGLGLHLVMVDAIGGALKAHGLRAHGYPAHPSLVRALDRSPSWAMRKRPGTFASTQRGAASRNIGHQGGRACAVFEYVGPAGDGRLWA